MIKRVYIECSDLPTATSLVGFLYTEQWESSVDYESIIDTDNPVLVIDCETDNPSLINDLMGCLSRAFLNIESTTAGGE